MVDFRDRNYASSALRLGEKKFPITEREKNVSKCVIVARSSQKLIFHLDYVARARARVVRGLVTLSIPRDK